jgi:hypothetical protein
MQVSTGTKPSNATWRGKLRATPGGTVEVVPDPNYGPQSTSPFPHSLDDVIIGWYDDAVKITFKGGGPAHISQAYLKGDGDDVIIEVKPA